MNCPQCHTTMQNGYIPTGGGIFWFGHQSGSDLFPMARALPGTSTWLRRAKLEAYHCTRCNLVTFRYGRQVDETETFRHR